MICLYDIIIPLTLIILINIFTMILLYLKYRRNFKNILKEQERDYQELKDQYHKFKKKEEDLKKFIDFANEEIKKHIEKEK